MLVARMMLAGYCLPKTFAACAIPLCLAALALTTLFAQANDYRLLAWGVPMGTLLAATVAQENLSLWRAAWLQRLGNASYAIYLTHDFAVSVVRVALQKTHLTGSVAYAFAIPLGLVLACLIGVIVHTLVEAPVTRFLHKRFPQRPESVATPTKE